jgi:Na+-transporting methylmalonyl-CoA/oxaloacetate decarboxylase gamma subunit
VSGQAKLSALGPREMDISTLAVSLMVGGLALVASGLVLLLPITRQISAKNESFEESQARTEYYLQQMREQRGER